MEVDGEGTTEEADTHRRRGMQRNEERGLTARCEVRADGEEREGEDVDRGFTEDRYACVEEKDGEKAERENRECVFADSQCLFTVVSHHLGCIDE